MGYTEMWQKDRSADAAGRLENLKELIRSMEEFENLQGFLEHISLVMDRDERRGRAGGQHHDACTRPRGWNSTPCSCPAGRKACFRINARSTSRAAPGWRKSAASPMSGLRARANAPRSISPPTGASTACGAQLPSRFLDELPPEHVEVTEAAGGPAASACRATGLALRRDGIVRLQLFDARLAARAGAKGRAVR